MKLEVTEAMKKEIIRLAAAELVTDLRRSMNVEQISADIHARVVDDIAKKVAGEFHKRINVEETVEKAVQGFERRVNDRLERTLASGLHVKLRS